jgi:predicted nucleic acid-binding Zn ribbon protein
MADTRKKMHRPAPLADLLAGAFQGKPAEKRLQEGKIWLVWDAAVGARIADKAHPVSFRDGVLTVAVASAPWMQQLTFLKQGIIEKLNERIGSDLVRDIYLKAGQRKSTSSADTPPRRKSRQLSREELDQISAQTAAIPDQDLRENFARLLARHLSEDSGK